MENIISNDKITEYLSDFLTSPFTLIDVGCSGGIHQAWEAFGEKIIGIGFDPVVAEIIRLNKRRYPQFQYVEGFVTGPKKSEAPSTFWNRLAVSETNKIIQEKKKLKPLDALKRNLWPDLKLSDKNIELEEYFSSRNIIPNFIKIDVDGDDFNILQSLKRLLDRPNVLGIGIEVNYCGTDAATQNTFHNVDRFLRKHGFELYDLTVRKYSLAALPAPYSITIPAQSNRGRPLQGDALYFKDLILLDTELATNINDILIMACLFSVFDQKDSCAELLLTYRDKLPSEIDLDFVLDQLVNDMNTEAFEGLNYKQLIKKFQENDDIFYPNYIKVAKERAFKKVSKFLKK